MPSTTKPTAHFTESVDSSESKTVQIIVAGLNKLKGAVRSTVDVVRLAAAQRNFMEMGMVVLRVVVDTEDKWEVF